MQRKEMLKTGPATYSMEISVLICSHIINVTCILYYLTNYRVKLINVVDRLIFDLIDVSLQ